MILGMIHHFMVVIQLAWLVLFSFFIIRAGEDTERKLINFLIIVGSAALGFSATLVIEYLTDSPEELALSIGIISGDIGCAIAWALDFGCGEKNHSFEMPANQSELVFQPVGL